MDARKLILGVLLFSAIPSSYALPACFTSLRALTQWAKLDPEIDRLFSANGLNDFSSAWRHLSKSKNLERFLADRGYTVAQVGESRRVELINLYFRDFFDQLRGDLLTFAQDTSLSTALKSHGIAPREDHVTSRQTLETTSRANRDRLVQEALPVSTEAETEAGKVVRSLELFPVHNTHQLSEIESGTPVLSSREIRRAGLRGGVNSQETFNRKFLRSDDQVFFHAGFSRSAKDAVVPDAEYGENGLVLKGAYAKASAWVSVYLMYPEELQAFAERSCPDLTAKLGKDAFAKFRRGEDLEPADEATLKAIRRRLGSFDFTVEDYTATVQRLLLGSLSELRAKNRKEYDLQMERLKSNDPRVIGAVLGELVFSRHKMPSRFEVKVPVAVPGAELIPVSVAK